LRLTGRLRPLNPDFPTIELAGSDEGGFQVIAELVEVLGDGPVPTPVG